MYPIVTGTDELKGQWYELAYPSDSAGVFTNELLTVMSLSECWQRGSLPSCWPDCCVHNNGSGLDESHR